MVEAQSAKANWKTQCARTGTPELAVERRRSDDLGVQEEPVVDGSARSVIGIMPADEAIALTEHEGIAPCVIQEAAQTGVEYAFDQHVDGFAGSTEAGFKHREARLHPEHQEPGDKRPQGIDRIDGRILRVICEIRRHHRRRRRRGRLGRWLSAGLRLLRRGTMR